MPQPYTLLPKLRTDRINTEGTYALVIVVTILRQRYLVPLGRNLSPAEWDANKKKAKGAQARANALGI